MEMTTISGGESISQKQRRRLLTPKACEGCRVRKIRCSRVIPCSNCQNANILCQQSLKPNPDPPPKRKLDLVESVEDIQRRLAVLEKTVECNRIIFTSSDKNQSSRSARNLETQSSICPKVTSSPYEGGSSFTKQCLQASELAQSTANLEQISEGSELGASFKSLAALLDSPARRPSVSDFHYSLHSPPQATSAARLVPIDLVLAILRKIKTQTTPHLRALLRDESLAERLCQKVYFATDPVSLAHTTSMYGILFYLLQDFIVMQDELGKLYDLEANLALCAQNFMGGIETYELLAVPSFESILALIIAIMKAQDDGKSLLCSTLLSAASKHCQLLGYHRESTYRTESSGNVENMRHFFWTVYMFDKNMSLHFGRASNIQDFEIDTKYPGNSNNASSQEWTQALILSIKFSKLQGQIYDRLYSAQALQLDKFDREKCVYDLTSALEDWHEQLKQFDSTIPVRTQVLDLTRANLDISYYSSLTTVQRATTATQAGCFINDKCLRAARLGLQSHLQYFPSFQRSRLMTSIDYANWVLLFSTFAPFLIVFMYTVLANSLDDLQLIDQVAESLSQIKAVSHRNERLYKVCKTLTKLARMLTESARRTGCSHEENPGWSSQVENYSQMTELQDFEDLLEHDAFRNTADLDSEGLSALLNYYRSEQPWTMGFFEAE